MGFSLDGSTVELRAKSNDVAHHHQLIHTTRHIFKYTYQYTIPFYLLKYWPSHYYMIVKLAGLCTRTHNRGKFWLSPFICNDTDRRLSPESESGQFWVWQPAWKWMVHIVYNWSALSGAQLLDGSLNSFSVRVSVGFRSTTEKYPTCLRWVCVVYSLSSSLPSLTYKIYDFF